MTNINASLSFSGLNMSKINPNDMKWLKSQPWWAKNKMAISELSSKYDIDIASSSQNIGNKFVHNIGTLEVIAKPLGSKSGIFGTTKGSAHFDVEHYNKFSMSDKTLLETVKKAIKDIRFLLFQ